MPKDPKKCKQIFIDITLKDKKFIEQIKKELQKFGVETLKPYCRISKSPSSKNISKVWELRIRRKKYIVAFLENIGFAHPDKYLRVDILLKYLGL